LLSTSLRAERLHLPGDLSVQSLSLDGDIKADPGSPFRLQLAADKLQAGSFSAEQLRAQGNGTRTRHHVQLDGRCVWPDRPINCNWLPVVVYPLTAGNGRVCWSGWSYRQAWAQPAIAAGAGGRCRPNTPGCCTLNVLGGSVSLAELDSSNGVLSTRGHAEGLHLAELAPLLPLPVEQNLVLDSAWALNLNGKQPQGQLWLKAGGR
jgi:translocation and assembly module TamB